MIDTACIKDKTIEELEEPLHTFPLGKASYYHKASLTLLAEVKRLREKNRSLFLQLSEAQGQLNAIHRGEQE